MDSLTHSLIGVCVSRASRAEQRTAYATATAILAAEIPDADFLFRSFGQQFYEYHHRGITHSLLAVPILSAVVIGVIYLYSLSFRREKPRWQVLYFLAVGCVLSHLASDLATSYGIRLLEPFSSRWFSLDLTLVLEPHITLALLIGVLLPRFSRLSKAVSGLVALSLVLGVYGMRAHYHNKAQTETASRLYDGQAPINYSSYPNFISVTQWHSVAETRDAIYCVDDRTQEFPRSQPTTAIRIASSTPIAKSYLFHASYPVIIAEGSEVRFYDARWLYPQISRTHAALVTLNESGEVLDSRITSLPVPKGSLALRTER